ncbi:MAG: helix-turn-helix transcriptional regulator [Pirellulaceae bacterium]
MPPPVERFDREVVKALRESRGWSQADLADAADISIRTLERAEGPGDGSPSMDTVNRIAAALEVPVDRLLSSANRTGMSTSDVVEQPAADEQEDFSPDCSSESVIVAPEDETGRESEEFNERNEDVRVNEPDDSDPQNNCVDERGTEEPKVSASLLDTSDDDAAEIFDVASRNTHPNADDHGELEPKQTIISTAKKALSRLGVASTVAISVALVAVPMLYSAFLHGWDGSTNSANTETMLRGRLIRAGANEHDQHPVAEIEVRLFGGDKSISDEDGYFQIHIPASANYRAGDMVKLCLHSEEWLIQHPLQGEFRLPSNPSEIIEFRVLPKGSKLFLSHEELEAFLAQGLVGSNIMPLGTRIASPRAALERVFKLSGYSDDIANLEIDGWVGEVEDSGGDIFQQGLAAHIAGDSKRAAALFDQNADANEERALLSRELAGDARVQQRDFVGALAAYRRTLKLLKGDRSDKYLRTRLSNKIACTEWSLAVRGDAATASAHLDNAVRLLTPLVNAERMSPPETAMIRHTLGRIYTVMAVQHTGGKATYFFDKANEALKVAYELYQFVPEEQGSVEYDRTYLWMKQAEQENKTSGRARLELASNACSNALALYSADLYKVERAAIQLRHGDVQAELALRSTGETAIEHVEMALNYCLSKASQVFSREQSPEEWAMIEFSCGKAYLARARNGSPAELELAEMAFRNALAEFTTEHLEQQNQLVREHLASALLVHFQRDGNQAALADALDGFKELDASLSREYSPFLWAQNKVNYGNALCIKANGEPASNARAILHNVFDLYNDALTVWSKESTPVRWAETNVNLANASSTLGNITAGEPGNEHLRNAKKAYENAITMLDSTSAAIARLNLGETLRNLGIRSQNQPENTLTSSVECLQFASQALDDTLYGSMARVGHWRSQCELAILSGSWPEFNNAIGKLCAKEQQEVVARSASPTDLRVFVLLAVGNTMSDQTPEATQAVKSMIALVEGQTEDLPVTMDFATLRQLLESHSPEALSRRQGWIRRLLDASELASREQMVKQLGQLVQVPP